MKKIVWGVSLLLILSCTHSGDVKVESVPPEKIRIVQTIAEQSMNELRKRLMKEFMEASKDGLTKAVSFCAQDATKIEEKVNSSLQGIKVTRVSLKYRNPKHKPDKVDVKVLNAFEEDIKRGMLPPYRMVKIEKGGKEYYLYYKPIRINTFCLKCHGNPKKMDKSVLQIIRKNYPEDKAVNYKIGELRGACKVIIPADKVK